MNVEAARVALAACYRDQAARLLACAEEVEAGRGPWARPTPYRCRSCRELEEALDSALVAE